MARWLMLFITCSALAGCYNPRYPSEKADAEAAERSDAQQSNVRDRDRRNAAAASGSTSSRSTGY